MDRKNGGRESEGAEGAEGMKPAICIEMLYPGLSPEEKIRRVADMGFRCIEFWGYKDKDLEAIRNLKEDYSVQIVNFSGQRAGDLIDASMHPVLLHEIEESVGVARALGTRTLMVLTNELGEGGKVLHPCPHIPDSEKHKNVVAGLKAIMQRVPDDMTIVLEPLNTVLDHQGYYLASMRDAIAIIDEVGNPRLRILCDFYHLALMGEDPVETVRQFAHYIGHIHIADYPGRHEPGTGRGAWNGVLIELQKRGYAGYVGFEFSPSSDTDVSLRAIRTLWREAFGLGALS